MNTMVETPDVGKTEVEAGVERAANAIRAALWFSHLVRIGVVTAKRRKRVPLGNFEKSTRFTVSPYCELKANIELEFDEYPPPEFENEEYGRFVCDIYDLDGNKLDTFWTDFWFDDYSDPKALLGGVGKKFYEKEIVLKNFRVVFNEYFYKPFGIEKHVKEGQKLTIDLSQEFWFIMDTKETHLNWFGFALLAQGDMELAHTNITTPLGNEGRTDVVYKKDGTSEEKNYYYLKDHLGSTRMVMDETGNAVEAYAYTAYGEIIALMQNPDEVREKFTGKEYDTEGALNIADLVLDINVYDEDPGFIKGKAYLWVEMGNVSYGQNLELNTASANDRIFSYFYKASFPFEDARKVTALSLNITLDDGTKYKYHVDVTNANGDMPLNTIRKIKLIRDIDEIEAAITNNVDLYEYELLDIPPIAGMKLKYYGARYYDPEIALWTSVDPVGEFWNSYSYVGGEPISLIDPSGMFSVPVNFQQPIAHFGVLNAINSNLMVGSGQGRYPNPVSGYEWRCGVLVRASSGGGSGNDGPQSETPDGNNDRPLGESLDGKIKYYLSEATQMVYAIIHRGGNNYSIMQLMTYKQWMGGEQAVSDGLASLGDGQNNTSGGGGSAPSPDIADKLLSNPVLSTTVASATGGGWAKGAQAFLQIVKKEAIRYFGRQVWRSAFKQGLTNLPFQQFRAARALIHTTKAGRYIGYSKVSLSIGVAFGAVCATNHAVRGRWGSAGVEIIATAGAIAAVGIVGLAIPTTAPVWAPVVAGFVAAGVTYGGVSWAGGKLVDRFGLDGK